MLALRNRDGPPVLLSTDTAVYIGIGLFYSAFMVLPIYAPWKDGRALIEAAADLGFPRVEAFLLVTLPLALPA